MASRMSSALAIGLLLMAGPALAGYYDEVVADSPVAYWRLNESSGTTAHDSAGTHNATYSGTRTLGQPGALVGDPDTAANFGGGHAVAPYSADLDGNTFSIECWAKPSTVGGGSWRSPLMFRYCGPSPPSPPECYGHNFYADATNENWEFWIGRGTAGGFAAVNGPDAQVGQWTHLLGTYDGATMRFYVDGHLRSSSVQPHGVNGNPGTSFEIAGGPRFLGDLDEVAVYSTALSANRAAYHYIAGKNLPVSTAAVWPGADLLALRLDEGTGSTTYDSSTHGAIGTLKGATWSAGRFGAAGSFDGASDRVAISGFPAGSYPQVTVEAWVKPGDKQGKQILIQEQSGDTLWMNFDTNGGDRLDVYLGDTTNRGYHSSDAALARGEWSHVAFTYDDTLDELKLYVNGLLDRTITTTGTMNFDSTLSLGWREDETSDMYKGDLDEVAIYSRVLSPDEILARFAGGPPVAYPEPTSLALFGLGSLLLAARRRRRRNPTA